MSPPFGLIQKARKKSRLRILNTTPNVRLAHFDGPFTITFDKKVLPVRNTLIRLPFSAQNS